MPSEKVKRPTKFPGKKREKTAPRSGKKRSLAAQFSDHCCPAFYKHRGKNARHGDDGKFQTKF